jgi:hypothetical protein
MTRGEFLKFLTEEAKKYHTEALWSIERSRHMNGLSRRDFIGLKKNRQLTQRLIDALLVDFINMIGVGQCVDYGLYTKDLKIKEAKMFLHHADPPCTTRLNHGFCSECNLVPDMQSTCFYFYCPSCDCQLKNMKCPKCKLSFKRPSR